MNIEELHQVDKEVSAAPLFKGETGATSALQLSKGGILKEHISKVPALLLCVAGKTEYHEEGGLKIALLPGDYVHIQPHVKHWLNALEKSQLLLLK